MRESRVTFTMPELQPGPTALYAQVASILRSQIAVGDFGPGDALPPIENLCGKYRVSRVTVRQAIHMLAGEGLLISRRGRRVTVAKRDQTPTVDRFRDVADALSQPEPDHKIIVLGRTADVRLPDGVCFVGSPVASYCRIRKIHMSGRVPYCTMELFIDQSIVDRWPRGIERREKLAPLIINGTSPRITVARERIVVAAADFNEAKLLEYPMAGPVARMTRILCDQAGRAVYFGRFTYRGDRFGIEREHGPYVRKPWEHMRASTHDGKQS